MRKPEKTYLLEGSEAVSPLDAHFADFLVRLEGRGDSALESAAALASHCTRMGHVCVDLRQVETGLAVEGLLRQETVNCPPLDDWKVRLKGASVVGEGDAYRPLIMDDRARVYLYRYWEYQDRLAEWITKKSKEDSRVTALNEGQTTAFQERLRRLFHEARDGNNGETDWQTVAALAAVRKRFSIITGGPGTGKTSVVCKILALLAGYFENSDLRIALAAPTGKAAARLQEAVKRSKERLDDPHWVLRVIPETATTIHRLLGVLPGSSDFYYNSKHKLPADIVVVDEASMVDLALLSKLVQALTPEATLILVGDKDQLASVEAGAVLGDICDTSELYTFTSDFRSELKRYTGGEVPEGSGNVLQDTIVELQRSYRFGPQSGIHAVSQAVNAGDGVGALHALKEGGYEDVQWTVLPSLSGLSSALEERAMTAYVRFLEATDVQEAFDRFDEFRILCALREGPYGVKGINQQIEEGLRRRGLVPTKERWYRGRPLLMTRNDYTLGIFNGDVGIVWPEDGRMLAFFRAGVDGFQRVHPTRLPDHETVYAMTVHKSQGSEFDDVLLVLPDRTYPVVTRELIYTGFTRARRYVEMWVGEEVFISGVSRKTLRMSGLADLIWKTFPDEAGHLETEREKSSGE